jgi:hypothetical protein
MICLRIMTNFQASPASLGLTPWGDVYVRVIPSFGHDGLIAD